MFPLLTQVAGLALVCPARDDVVRAFGQWARFQHHGARVAPLVTPRAGRTLGMGFLILVALAALLFRWQGDAWTVVAGKLLLVVVLYLVTIYVVFGIGIGGLS